MHSTRRDFLKSSLGASAALTFGTALPEFLGRTAAAAPARPGERQRVLVVLQLSGGNDGLNTVVPYENDVYHRHRPTLGLTAERVLPLGSGLGLHPELATFLRLYQEGHLSIVQGVGPTKGNRDHGAAMRGWHTAFQAGAQTGWLGRVVDQFRDASAASAAMPGAFVGPIRAPFGIHSERGQVPSLHLGKPWLSAGETGSGDSPTQLHSLVAAPRNQRGALLDWLQASTLEALAAGQRLQSVLSRPAASKPYPSFPLAQTLQSIAQLIRADLGLRVFFAESGGGGIGGFDTHSGQALNHGALLRELADSVAAFVDDLQRDHWLDSVLLMTFSEFGRTLTENGRHGTDHGAAAPVFLAGSRLKGGLIGAQPSLTDLEADAPKPHTEPGRLYATVLEGWLGLDSRSILGKTWTPLSGVLA